MRIPVWKHGWLPVSCLAILVVVGLIAALPRSGLGGFGKMPKKKTVADRMAEFGPAVQARLAPELARTGIAWPPRALILVGLKQERRLEVWAAGAGGKLRQLKSYPIVAASGRLGPKLQEGDRQVPEGLYSIPSLNPNSLYHLALRIGYPNELDRAMGKNEGRSRLGGDIMIHGKDCSVGCLAMGDLAAEELFVLAAATGIDKVQVILSPVDFRCAQLPDSMPPVPAWTPLLYNVIRTALEPLHE